MSKISIYKTHWNPELPAFDMYGNNVVRPQEQQFTYLFSQLTTAILSKYPDAQLIDIPSLEGTQTILGMSISLINCEMIVVIDDKLILLSFSDHYSDAQNALRLRNNPDDVMVYCNHKLSDTFDNVAFTVKSSPYVARYAVYDLDMFHTFRHSTTLNDKLFFRGNYKNLPRNAVFSLMDDRYKNIFLGADGTSPEQYLYEITHSTIGLSIPGMAEFCHRDVEYMAIGVPMMRFEYLTDMEPKLIPNVHYISIPRIDTSMGEERSCGKENLESGFIGQNEHTDKYAELYYEKFMQVKDDKDFLDSISRNARAYYQKYMHPRNRVEHFMKLMEL